MKTLGNKLLKYKMHHVLFWIVYYVGWIQVYRNYYENITDLMQVTLVYGIAHASLYYTSQYILIPRFWKKRQPVKFILAFMVLLLVSVVFMYVAIKTILGDLFLEAFDGAIFPWFVFFGTSNLFWVTLMLSVKAMIDNFRNQRANERKEKQRLESELQFLKAQVNPHFLFNTINSVYVLIGQDPKKASDTLIKLSDLLRAQLYDFGNEQIPIDQELEYLENYMELEKIRKGKKLTLEYEKDVQLKGFSIAPLLLVPFLENCFKHLSSFNRQPNIIRIRLKKDEKKMKAYFFNTHDGEVSKNTSRPGGIGLKNVRRRLELLYQDAHTLTIHELPESYEVTLTLEINAK